MGAPLTSSSAYVPPSQVCACPPKCRAGPAPRASRAARSGRPRAAQDTSGALPPLPTPLSSMPDATTTEPLQLSATITPQPMPPPARDLTDMDD